MSTSYAVLAKARAKYGRFLNDRDYASILACQSVAEVMIYLKSHTHFASVLNEVNEHQLTVHRDHIGLEGVIGRGSRRFADAEGAVDDNLQRLLFFLLTGLFQRDALFVNFFEFPRP